MTGHVLNGDGTKNREAEDPPERAHLMVQEPRGGERERGLSTGAGLALDKKEPSFFPCFTREGKRIAREEFNMSMDVRKLGFPYFFFLRR